MRGLPKPWPRFTRRWTGTMHRWPPYFGELSTGALLPVSDEGVHVLGALRPTGASEWRANPLDRRRRLHRDVQRLLAGFRRAEIRNRLHQGRHDAIVRERVAALKRFDLCTQAGHSGGEA